MVFGGKPRRAGDPMGNDYKGMRKTAMVALGENTTIKVSAASAIFLALAGCIWWAAHVDAKASQVEKDQSATSKELRESKKEIIETIKTVSDDIRETKEAVIKVDSRQRAFENRIDRMEMRQINEIRARKERDAVNSP